MFLVVGGSLSHQDFSRVWSVMRGVSYQMCSAHTHVTHCCQIMPNKYKENGTHHLPIILIPIGQSSLLILQIPDI